ncbi:ATP-binding protein [Catellatospora sichuanensis]|uniref:ATP-binding protein n=1 Tax=Catellatospora sichuanensis TaxID=1969805 RepID=UPI001182E95F|nr:helix-turn-helix domain-containing protein [Catellatospora sichuanensis]
MAPGHPVPAEAADASAASFSALLRAHRDATRLTQSELAARAGLGVRTVRDLEHGRAARPQRSTVELLVGALSLTGDAAAEFHLAARGQAPQPSAPIRPAFTLPAPPELYGRAEESAALIAHLAGRPGLTTLVGLAGVGKSALALSVAHQAQPQFPTGVHAISVAAGDTVTDIREVVCAVLEVSRPADLPTRLEQPVLLMVDAVDRSPDAFRTVLAELVAVAPALRVLASARAPLGPAGEHVWPLGPLALPPAGTRSLGEAERHPASALFLARWRQVRRSSADVEVEALVTLVRRLGGLPLAIELAAARGRVLDPAEMLARYGNRLLELGSADVAASPPVVTLRDVVTASYRLLEPAQREALRRLAVFGYRWSVELAEDLLGPQVDVVPVLERLVELGLVQVRGSGAFRFVLLDVVKEYATEQAEVAGELAEARRQHGVVFARFAARTAPTMVGSTLAAAVARLDDVASDLWAALAHAAEHDPHTALCLASKLPRWWRFRGRDQQGRQWLLRLLDDPRTADADPIVRAWANLGVVQLAAEHGAGRAELARGEAALAAFLLVGDVTGELAARAVLQVVHQSAGEYDDARRHGEATLALATRTGRVDDMAVAQHNLIWHDLREADLAAAQRRLAAVDRLSARSGEHKLRALARANLAEVLRLDGRYDEAVRVGLQAAEMLAEVGNPGERRRLVGVVGLAYAQGGRLEEAEKTLSDIRAVLLEEPGPGVDVPGATEPEEDWHCAMIEATVAWQRGHRTLAASWFAAAARLTSGLNDRRDMMEALVGLAATSDEPAEVVTRLYELRDSTGISLTPHALGLLSNL